jgi:hypothetical protein
MVFSAAHGHNIAADRKRQFLELCEYGSSWDEITYQMLAELVLDWSLRAWTHEEGLSTA